VDVLVVAGPEVTLRAARDATRTMPIVMIAVDYDPIALGYIAGLPRPGGNITGVVSQQLQVTGKCLELLKDALPQLTRVAVLWDVPSADQFRTVAEAARVLGMQVHSLALFDPPAYDYEGAFAAAAREGAEALMVLQSPLFSAARARITGFEPNPVEYQKLVERRTDSMKAGAREPAFKGRRYFPNGVWSEDVERTLYVTAGAGAVTLTGPADEDMTSNMFRANDRGLGALREAGVRHGDLVMVTLRTTPSYLLCWLALASIGAVTVAANPRSSPAELAGLAHQTSPRAVITDAGLYPLITEAGSSTFQPNDMSWS